MPAYTALPRITALALSPDGERLVAAVQAPDAEAAGYASSLWEVPLGTGDPVRLTRSQAGEKSPVFLPGGRLGFLSARPAPGIPGESGTAEAGEAALWALPPAGEAERLLTRPGGLGSPVSATDSGHLLLTGARLAFSTDTDDEQRRLTRARRKVTAVLHDGLPIRYWDHELGVESPRLLLRSPDGQLRDLAPEASVELTEAEATISADGSRVATTWRRRRRGGRFPYGVAVIETATGQRRDLLVDDERTQYGSPVISPYGGLVAVQRERQATFAGPPVVEVVLVRADGSGDPVVAALDDLYPQSWVWSPDGSTLFVSGDLHGRGAVAALDPATGQVRSWLARDASYSALCPAPDGSRLYALRSTIDSPPSPVLLDTAAQDQTPVALPSPAPVPPLPGRLQELQVPGPDGADVHGWLCTPDGADAEHPAPVMVWIHGGPFTSWNAWSWRWNPWVAVAHGWAVVLPDPAMSTGYGQGWLERAWPYQAADVFADVETVLDQALREPTLDATRVACLGASFGGYMTNWIAGHSDRFAAIVTHAGLWSLGQQHKTTDGAPYKMGIFGQEAEHPDWFAANSPDAAAQEVRTPMLVVHGNRDYRVPVSEALRLWWDLVSGWPGEPETMPHRFLQLLGENHWVLSPANHEVWYDTVLGFCAQHVLGEPFLPSPGL